MSAVWGKLKGWLLGCVERKERMTRLQVRRCDRELQRKRVARAALRDHLSLQSDA